MMRWLRRLFWFALLAAAGCGAYRVLSHRRAAPTTTAQRSPLPATSNRPTGSARPAGDAATTTAPRWVAPDDGECPDGYPVKVNESSGIFHVPGGRSYARTTATRCYASAEHAIADGFRPAKA